MLIRLANVIYWTCTVIAVLWAAVAIYATFMQTRPEWGMGAAIAAVISMPMWLFGRAFRYIVTGK